MPAKERHELVNLLLGSSVFENNKNIRVSYQLLLSAERCVEKEVVKLVHWDKKSKRLFIDVAFAENQKASAEFVNFFATEVAEGLLLQERESVVNDLRNLIQMGFLFEFQEHSVQFLLTRENIEVPMEDEEFIDSAFIETEGYAPSLQKRASAQLELQPPFTPTLYQYSKKRRLDKTAGNRGKSKHVSKNVNDGSSTMKVGIKNIVKPKMPLSAFFVFLAEYRKRQKLKGACNQPAIVSKAASEEWNAMSDLEKGPYLEVAKEKLAEYKKELEAYNRKSEDQHHETSVKEEPKSDGSKEDGGSIREHK